jgi:hypothetical protein
VPQATLALPMLCFPAVLFSGAILPVNLMAGTGAALSTVIPTRWAFEAIGHDLGARQLLAEGGSPLGPPLLESYGDAGTQPIGTYWLTLAAFAVVSWSPLGLCSSVRHAIHSAEHLAARIAADAEVALKLCLADDDPDGEALISVVTRFFPACVGHQKVST